MSPKNKIKLNLFRKKLDKLDDSILKLIKKRSIICLILQIITLSQLS